MSTRKCIYTGEQAGARDTILPKKSLREDEKHNWVTSVPISLEYKNFKKDRMPNDNEMEAYLLFIMLETSRVEVRYLEDKLVKIQKKLKKTLPKIKLVSNKKAKQIEQAVHEKEIVQKSEEGLKEVLKSHNTLWE